MDSLESASEYAWNSLSHKVVGIIKKSGLKVNIEHETSNGGRENKQAEFVVKITPSSAD